MKYTAIKSALMRMVAVMLLLVGSASASAQYYSSQYRMVIRTIDGLAYPFNVELVDSVYFEMVQSEANGNDEDETTVTGGATEITNYTATITSWANILDNLSSDIKVGIIYTTEGIPSKSNGTQITVSTSSLGSDAKYTVTLENLSQSTTYYYRSFVYQSGIWFYGDVKEFTTKGLGAELVSGEVSKLTCYSAKVNCSVNIDESIQYSTLTYGICYGTDTVPTVNDSKVQADSKDQDGNFSCQLRALTGSTTYYYRAYAYVDGYLSYGPIRSFTTKADDVVITGDIDTVSFTVKSALKISSGAYSTLELGVCYGTNDHPTVSDKTVTTNEVDDENNFTLTLKDIPFGAVYYYCSYVKIDGVAHYGAIKSFILCDVDLGLSVKWAFFNMGASKPEEYGDYYAWGETEPKTDYSWSTYKWCNGSSSTQTKYNTLSSYGTVDNKTTLDPEDDVAHVKWGGSWRMPTKAEQDELRNNCTWTWYGSGNTEFNGVVGYKVTSNVTGYTDRSIFLPFAGSLDDMGRDYVGLFGDFWSSSLNTYIPCHSYYLYIDSSVVSFYDIYYRYAGRSVRPVCPSDEWLSSVSISFVEDNKTLLVDGSAALSVVVKKNNEVYYYNPEWNSDNPSVAIVDQNGVVTAMSAGTAHITASIQTISVQCTVTVTDNDFEIEHEYVDLGLSVKWATFNVGALSPEDLGAYYAWGETEPKTDYSWSTYKWCNGSYNTQTKYNTSTYYGTVDNKTTLDPEDDVAHVKWGGNWRMPTKAEQDELRNNCTWTWYDSGNTEFNGIAGYKVTSNKAGYTDRSIFLPAAGCRSDTCLSSVGDDGNYWSSSLYTDNTWARRLIFDSGDLSTYHSDFSYRYNGFSVRPVCPSDEWLSSVSISFVEDNKTLLVDGSAVLNVIIKQNNDVLNNCPTPVIWSSDAPSVAIADDNGVVTAISAGTAHITASIRSLSVQCTVTVIEECNVEHEYVDLGLSVKWATFNVGALSPEEYGAYYAWGETEAKTDYSWSTYKWCNGSYDTQTKYNTLSSYGTVDNKTTLDPEDDVAYVKWGGNWRMPTKAEQDELRNNCTWTWYDSGNSEFNGIAGYKVTSNKAGYTDRSIFLPAAGHRSDTRLSNVGYYGYYWSNSLTGSPDYAWYIDFGSDDVRWGSYYRDYGQSVRPVCPSDEWLSSVSISFVEDNKTLLVDGSAALSVVVKKNNEVYYYNPEWNSDNPSVAIVDQNGVVTAMSAGTAHITASIQTVSVQCTVTVIEESEVEPKYVDLGLSVKWGTFNVGALSPEDLGAYYAWGETEAKTDYSWSTYKWCNGSYDTQTKYNTLSSYGTVDNKTTLDPEDDVAYVKWGGNWRMPTKAEQDELRNNCTWTWYDSGNSEFNGIAGYKVTSNKAGYTDRSIFLPAAGHRSDTRLSNVGYYGYYWSNSLDTGSPDYAWSINFESGYVGLNGYDRTVGLSVRPVCP